MANFWIFVMVEYNDYNMSILDTIKKVGQEKTWRIGARTANKLKIQKGDNILVYTSGEGNREFIASAKLDSGYINEGRPNYGHVKLTEIKIFEKKIPLRSMINKLDFIKNKTRYGSHFQSGVITIGEKDYKKIVKKSLAQSQA
jgi:hypothetical protein